MKKWRDLVANPPPRVVVTRGPVFKRFPFTFVLVTASATIDGHFVAYVGESSLPLAVHARVSDAGSQAAAEELARRIGLAV